MENKTRVIVLYDTIDRLSDTKILAGTVLFDVVLIEGGYNCDWVGTRVEVSNEDVAIMLSDN